VGDEAGRVKELVTVEVGWETDAQGRSVPVEQPGTERRQPAQLVLLAMGFTGPDGSLPLDLGIELDERRNIRADAASYTTSVPGVFAAGDCRRGQSLVVWAIAEGRGAARECDRWLMGSTDLP
jgi:glutamate synthase (NADPH/NADH) small chain